MSPIYSLMQQRDDVLAHYPRTFKSFGPHRKSSDCKAFLSTWKRERESERQRLLLEVMVVNKACNTAGNVVE